MTEYSRKQIVASKKGLQALLDLRFHPAVEHGGISLRRYTYLIDSIQFHRTPQGREYWNKKYYWFAGLDIPSGNYAHQAEAMTDGDWRYLESLVEPTDSFLTEKENKEYVDFALAIPSKV